MKETIKTMIVFFSFLVPLFGQGGENYRAFNRLIRQTDIENFYTVNELRALFEDPLFNALKCSNALLIVIFNRLGSV